MHLVFLCNCASPEKTQKQLFLENVMIRECGLYVLMGSKPMCCFDIEDGFSDSHQKARYEKYLSNVDNSSIPPMSYDEFKQEHTLPFRLHHRVLWKDWNENKQSSISPCYKFVSRRAPFDQESELGYFINVPSTTHLLKKHYAFFAQITGIDFDMYQILNEISDNDSIFWEKTFQSHYLMGLLFGFGERNAFFFDWGVRNNSFPPAHRKKGQEPANWSKSQVSCSDLKLPLYGVFLIDDASVKKYEKERKHIMKQLKGKDFVKVVETRLSGDPPLEDTPRSSAERM